MNMHAHFDESHIESAMDRCEASLAEAAVTEGKIGVMARMTIATMRPFNLALVREINGGAGCADIAAATSNLICNQLLTLIDSVTNKDLKMRATLMQAMLDDMANTLAYTLNGGEYEYGHDESVFPVPGGRA